MATLRAHLDRSGPYFISATCIEPNWFSLPNALVWGVMSEQLHFIRHAYGVRIRAFILLQNEIFLLIETPNRNLSASMNWFMKETSRSLVRAAGRINQCYRSRYHRCLLTTHHQFRTAYKYLYHSSIVHGLSQEVLNYPFSTLPGLLGKHHQLIPVSEDQILFGDIERTLKWLNLKPGQEDWFAVKRALKKREFSLGRKFGRIHPLESNSL